MGLATVAASAGAPGGLCNGGFEDGLSGWQATGDVRWETNQPLDGKASARLGPGAGSLTQRIETASGNAFTLSATLQCQRTNGWVLLVRFLDRAGREVMRVDSLADFQIGRHGPGRFSHYMKAHPLTKWIEIVISKDASPGSLLVDQVALEMPDENAAEVQPACDLDQAMRPFWLDTNVCNEAVLLVSSAGKPAFGQLMFRPTRIISVRDYGLATNYLEGRDYTLEGRTLRCTPTSRMVQVRAEDLPQGELKWNNIGGQQVMVTYEHADTWAHPMPAFVGDALPHTVKKLEAREPLRVVAYGDSITHGLGESRLAHIRPFLPPWPELFVHRLQAIYHDPGIQLYNSAQSGADSNWGRKYAERMVNSLKPDLVIIAFGQNDFWGVPASVFAGNISNILETVRRSNPDAEFLLVSPLRFDPAYTAKPEYWQAVGGYAAKLKGMAGPGVQFVDMTALSEAIYAAKKPKDCLNDPLHPNDYLARWYAQSLVATLDPYSGQALVGQSKHPRLPSVSRVAGETGGGQ